MEAVLSEQDQRIAETVTRERRRLRNFIRSRVPDPRDAEDILQDVFYELVEAYRAMMPLDEVTGWLFRVAKNRIIDLLRRKKPEALSESAWLSIAECLPSPDGRPSAAYTRGGADEGVRPSNGSAQFRTNQWRRSSASISGRRTPASRSST